MTFSVCQTCQAADTVVHGTESAHLVDGLKEFKGRTIQLKMGRGPEQTLLPRRHTNVQQVYKKVLNITALQGIANKNHSEISLHTGRAIVRKLSENERGKKEKSNYL